MEEQLLLILIIKGIQSPFYLTEVLKADHLLEQPFQNCPLCGFTMSLNAFQGHCNVASVGNLASAESHFFFAREQDPISDCREIMIS